MTDRTFVCTCEDVELQEIEESIERGYTTIEGLKRATAVTTGPCQGAWCLGATLRVLAKATDQDPGELGAITHRPPTHGAPLGALAKAPLPDDAGPAEPGTSSEDGPGHAQEVDDA
ncbi:MAG: (2Fe-2S)-binding protein [Candidatus Thermoplasmatota archaeon]|nr:(2Fe-2S)-binding protein [Candidatus Thermoplasmatota archaeon]